MAGFGGLFERCGAFSFLNFTHQQLKERKFHTLSFTSSAHLRNSKPEGGAQTLRCVSARADSLTYRQLKFNLLPQYLPLKTYHFRTNRIGGFRLGITREGETNFDSPVANLRRSKNLFTSTVSVRRLPPQCVPRTGPTTMGTKESFYQYRFVRRSHNNAYATVPVPFQQCIQQVPQQGVRDENLHTVTTMYVRDENLLISIVHQVPVPVQQCIQSQQCLQKIGSLLRTPYCTQKLLWKLLIKGITVTKLKRQKYHFLLLFSHNPRKASVTSNKYKNTQTNPTK